MRRFLRALVVRLAVAAFLATVVGGAWLTHHPDHPKLEEAEGWPVIGGLARSFRAAYLPPVPPAAAEQEATAETAAEEPLEIFAPRAAATHTHAPVGMAALDLPPLPEPIAWRWLLPEQPLQPSRASGEGAIALGSLSYVPILEREGSWARVLFWAREWWIDEEWNPPSLDLRRASQGPLRRRISPVQDSSPERLAEAGRILGLRAPVGHLGPYRLWTDVDDPALLEALDEVASVAEEAYSARYGRLPSGVPVRSAVLFAREADYRRFASPVSLPWHQSGHAEPGLLALFAEGRAHDRVLSTLVHEIAHLLSSRALAPDLPPWLGEGIAEDLAATWSEPVGSADYSFARAAQVSYTPRPCDQLGIRVLFLDRLRPVDELPDLATVLLASHDEFYATLERVRTGYPFSGVLVCYLLDGDGGRYRDGFRQYLERIAQGDGPDLEHFLDSFGARDPAFLAELEGDFRSWLSRESRRTEGRLVGTAESRARAWGSRDR
jgi:hypothetical protein